MTAWQRLRLAEPVLLLYWVMLGSGLALYTLLRADDAAALVPLWAGAIMGTLLGQILALANYRWWAALAVIGLVGFWLLPGYSGLVGIKPWVAVVPAGVCGYWSLGDRGALVAWWFPTMIWMLSILDSIQVGVSDRLDVLLGCLLAAAFVVFLRVRESRRVALWRTVAATPLATTTRQTVLRETPRWKLARGGWTIVTAGLTLVITAWLAPLLWRVESQTTIVTTRHEVPGHAVEPRPTPTPYRNFPTPIDGPPVIARGPIVVSPPAPRHRTPCCIVEQHTRITRTRIKEYLDLGRGRDEADVPMPPQPAGCRVCRDGDDDSWTDGAVAELPGWSVGPLVRGPGDGWVPQGEPEAHLQAEPWRPSEPWQPSVPSPGAGQPTVPSQGTWQPGQPTAPSQGTWQPWHPGDEWNPSGVPSSQPGTHESIPPREAGHDAFTHEPGHDPREHGHDQIAAAPVTPPVVPANPPSAANPPATPLPVNPPTTPPAANPPATPPAPLPTPTPPPAPAAHPAPPAEPAQAVATAPSIAPRSESSKNGPAILHWLAVLAAGGLIFQLLALALRPIRRLVTLRHLRRPFWDETVEQRVSNSWQLALVGLRDAGWRAGSTEPPRDFARRVGVEGVEHCATILERARHGIGIDAADLSEMSAAAEAAYRSARAKLGVGGRTIAMVRWPLA